ncbi:hypothetical protein [Arthrobacter sp. SLBN-112]|uniref:hypothetical protein n=1 Tax=Arthrobacter sp. SLBN-112 TaxID=2768452 RepID=UPI0027B3233F|nr:hypothetical protein [Arthrobacter sp. SLBN-112]MDQ0798729.1 hypothetical protein [Arthrobacter sp. SLBN-112]
MTAPTQPTTKRSSCRQGRFGWLLHASQASTAAATGLKHDEIRKLTRGIAAL